MKLSDIIEKPCSGEWGTDDECGNGIPVLRTTNFTNEGIINYSNVCTRTIDKSKAEKKFLQHGDIIIEKSGGSDKQPVGRVVYFDRDDNKYLFNNFTAALRVKNKSEWDPKYVFFALFCNYLSGKTRMYQNKTTGLHNLQLSDYINDVIIPDNPLEIQREIAYNLDKVSEAIELCRKILEKLDYLVKSKFVEMFGNVLKNDRNWHIYGFNEIATSRLGKMLDAKQNKGINSYPYLANFNVQWFRFELNDLRAMDFDKDDQKEFELKDGDLLVCEGGEIGRCAVWHNEIQPCYFQKALHRIRCFKDKVLPDYFAWWFRYNCDNGGFENIAGAKATIAHLPGAKLKELKVAVPPLQLQEQFAAYVKKTDLAKSAVKKTLDKAQTLKNALMQKYFG